MYTFIFNYNDGLRTLDRDNVVFTDLDKNRGVFEIRRLVEDRDWRTLSVQKSAKNEEIEIEGIVSILVFFNGSLIREFILPSPSTQ